MTWLKVPFETAEERGVTLDLNVPDSCHLMQFVPNEPAAVPDVARAVLDAVEHPIGSKPFSGLVAGGKKVLLMIENQFRAAPADKMLPPLVELIEKAGGSVKIFIGSGKVGPLSEPEIKDKIGEALFAKGIPVACNDVSKSDDYTFYGVSTRGIPLWVHKWVAEADVKVTLGTTQATLWGYGSSGMVIPGAANNETIELNHVMSLSPESRPGNNDCAIQLDKYEAMKTTGIDMSIHAIVSNRFDVTHVIAGEPVASHRESVRLYDSIYRFKADRKADIVICGSTAPTNHLFFHTSWAVVNVDPVTKDDGTILFASPCPGYHAWPGFALMDLLKAYMPPSPANHENALKDFYSHKNELWAGCIWYKVYELMVQKTTRYITYAENLPFAREVGLDAHAGSDIQAVFDQALAKAGPNATVAFVPYGRYTILD